MSATSDSSHAARVREAFTYDHKTGDLKWAIDRQKCGLGSIAGSFTATGYREVTLDGRHYKCHRVVWFLVTGEWPKHQIDHLNGNRADNRFENLRDATPSTNTENYRVARRNNATGFLGVHRKKRGGMYAASIMAQGRRIHIGCFTTPEEAHAAYVEAKRQLHPGCTI